MKILLWVSLFLFAFASCGKKEVVEANYQVIPLPQDVALTKQEPFTLSKSTRISYPSGNKLMQNNALFLADYIPCLA